MQINELYELIPWEILKKWAEAVSFDEKIISSNFPKYKDWSNKAVYADFLMDHVDEGFNYEDLAYPKADAIQEQDLKDRDFIDVYKLFFDSSRAEENFPGTEIRAEWEKRLQRMAEYFKTTY